MTVQGSFKMPPLPSCTLRDYLNAGKAMRMERGLVLLQNRHLLSSPSHPPLPLSLGLTCIPPCQLHPLRIYRVLCFELPLPWATSRCCCFNPLPLPSFLCARELSQEFCCVLRGRRLPLVTSSKTRGILVLFSLCVYVYVFVTGQVGRLFHRIVPPNCKLM